MRLSETERAEICRVLRAVDPFGRVFLFGSIADDSRKGGDIDLFLEASHPVDTRTRLQLEWQLTTAIDTHVDLLVKNPDQDELPIHAIARSGVLL